MSNITNIKIEINNNNHLDYKKPEDLGIKLNRIVDNYADPSKRYGDYSYTFDLPKTKNNDNQFEFADVKGRTKIFVGKTFDCNVYNNNKLLLQGIIELVNISETNYGCIFYSKFTELSDILKVKNLQDMTALPTVVWNYEQSIIRHINGIPLSVDIEFPFIYYRTPFMSGATPTNVTTPSQNYNEACLAYYYNYIVSSLNFGTKNPFYQQAFPPAIYLKSVMDGIFSDAGWTYNSSFFERADIQSIIIPFTGKGEDFTGSIITGVTDFLNLNKLLPNMKQSDFLKTIMNTFNLYMIVDNFTKNVVLETYNTLFSNNSNPYKIDIYDYRKIKLDDINIETTEDKDLNDYPLGFNRIMDYDRLSNPNPSYNVETSIDIRDTLSLPRIRTAYKKDAWTNTWNKTNSVTTKSIKLNLSPVNYFPYNIQSERSVGDATTTGDNAFTVGVPLITTQLPSDNKGNNFADELDIDYVQGNDPTNFEYGSGFKLLYYYGVASYNLGVPTSTTYKDWLYVLIATGGTVTVPTFARTRVCLASPFRLISTPEYNKLIVNGFISVDDQVTEKGMEAHGCLLTYLGAGTTGNTHTPNTFNLNFNANPLYESIYSYLHKKKYDDINNNYILRGKMRMNENDWNAMQINRTLQFNDELYKLVAIKNYDPVSRTAEIELLKKTN